MSNLSTDQSLPCIYYEVFSYATYIILDQILLLKRVTALPKLLANTFTQTWAPSHISSVLFTWLSFLQ